MPPYCPKRGDVVWISFTPQAGHEQTGHRPALVLSPQSYNLKVGLAMYSDNYISRLATIRLPV